MSESHTKLSLQVMQMLDEQVPKRDIEQALIQKGFDEFVVKNTIEECTQLRNNRRRARGMLLVVAGALTCLTSFVLTMSSASLQNSSWQLFGLTSVGVTLVLAGLLYIFS